MKGFYKELVEGLIEKIIVGRNEFGASFLLGFIIAKKTRSRTYCTEHFNRKSREKKEFAKFCSHRAIIDSLSFLAPYCCCFPSVLGKG